MAKCMLSTIDNPFNPFDEYEQWYAFDVASGYNTGQFLARIVKASDDLSDADYDLAIEQAIDECVMINVLGVFVKITKEE